MPCNCDYMNPTERERELSKVACLLDELNGKKFDKSHWEGQHPSVWGQRYDGDELVSELCSRLQSVSEHMTEYSLEMQIWWRDHQVADKERLKKELAAKKDKKTKQAALAKLTQHERRLLGF